MPHIPDVSPATIEVLSTAHDADGRWFAFASFYGATRRWAIGPDGPPDVTYPSQNESSVLRVVAPAADSLLIGADLGTIWRWNLSTGEPIGDPIRGKDEWHLISLGDSLAIFDLDGRPTIVTGGYHLQCWDLWTGTQVGEPWRADSPKRQVKVMLAAAVLPDGTPVVLSGGFDGVVRRWDIRTGTALAAPMRDCGKVSSLLPVRWPDGRAVVCVVSADGTVHRRDIRTGDPVAEPIRTAWDPSARPLERIWSAAVADLVVTCVDGTTAQTWDLVTGEPRIALRPSPAGRITAIAAAELPDGSPIVLIAADDGTVRSYDARTGTALGDVVRPHGYSLSKVGVVRLPDRRTILAVHPGGGKCFDAATGDPVSTSATAAEFGIVPAYLQDGRVLLLDADDEEGGITRWDLLNDEELPRLGGAGDPVFEVVAMPLPDGRVLAIGRYEDGTVRRWDAATGEPVGEPIPGPQGDVGALAAAGGILVTGDSTGTVHRWDPVTGEPLAQARIPETDGIHHVGVLPLPDGERMIVATGCDGSLTRWPTADLGTADRADVGDDPDLMGLQFDPTGVPVAYIRLLGTRNAPVQRWRLDTLERIDTLPDTVRAVYDSTMVHSDTDGSLRTEPLPPLPIG